MRACSRRSTAGCCASTCRAARSASGCTAAARRAAGARRAFQCQAQGFNGTRVYLACHRDPINIITCLRTPPCGTGHAGAGRKRVKPYQIHCHMFRRAALRRALGDKCAHGAGRGTGACRRWPGPLHLDPPETPHVSQGCAAARAGGQVRRALGVAQGMQALVGTRSIQPS